MFWNRLKKHHIKNFVNGKVFPQEVSQQIVECEKNEDKIYDKNDKRVIAICWNFCSSKKAATQLF